MTAARRLVEQRESIAAGAPRIDFDAGGQIADLQAEIERRMRADPRLPASDPAGDRIEGLIRRLSVAGGYVALGGGYALAVGAWFIWA